MMVYHWLLLAGFCIFLVVAAYMILNVIFTKGIPDPAPGRGNILKAELYSFTGAMSPVKKESAYLHLPTYTAGMIYHIGTFLSFLWLVILFFNLKLPPWIQAVSAVFLTVSGACGNGILVKRIVVNKLRNFSNPDDYFSNILVTGFQFITMFSLLYMTVIPALFVYAAVLFIYIPVGKLRHSIYFFTTRIQLAKHFGKRGVWPVKKPLS